MQVLGMGAHCSSQLKASHFLNGPLAERNFAPGRGLCKPQRRIGASSRIISSRALKGMSAHSFQCARRTTVLLLRQLLQLLVLQNDSGAGNLLLTNAHASLVIITPTPAG